MSSKRRWSRNTLTLTLILMKMTSSCCRCEAFYDRSNDYSHKSLIKRLILLGSPRNSTWVSLHFQPAVQIVQSQLVAKAPFWMFLLPWPLETSWICAETVQSLAFVSWMEIHWDPTSGLTWRCLADKKKGKTAAGVQRSKWMRWQTGWPRKTQRDKIFEHFVNFILLFISTTEQCS